ncbi:hypothetical protein D9611_006074 [Ephemerocybe angulata]|uniref:Fungal-type protein kinase domain-containing protein n=1 Tax=Ephemerocybe angulata TaxID=980116 RepID=A0A8H5FLR4_9AGAR|nr:hypothetical protein D9611_006074 [Tulosesus angulatus]
MPDSPGPGPRTRARSRAKVTQPPPQHDSLNPRRSEASWNEDVTASSTALSEPAQTATSGTPVSQGTEQPISTLNTETTAESHTATQQEERTYPFPAPKMVPATPVQQTALRKSQESFEGLGCPTPFRADSHVPHGNTKAQQLTVLTELGKTGRVKKEYLHTLYNTPELNDSISDFLRDSPLYDSANNHWAEVPDSVDDEKVLYAPYIKIIQAILDGPGQSNANGSTASRIAVDTHKTNLVHYDMETQTKPDIVIKATGPSFQEPIPLSKQDPASGMVHIGWCNIACVFDVKRNSPDGGPKAQLGQIANYNRQVIISQPNRRLLRSLIMTETRFRYFHLDRSGAFYTEYMDIHGEAATFVRLVIGLSSRNEADIGLDTNIQWEIEDGMKTRGTITTIDGDGNRIRYALEMDDPRFIQHTIRGRGTIHWYAKREDSDKRVVIKESWKADGRSSEKKLLERLSGANKVNGFAELISYEDNIAQTKDYRPDNFVCDDFVNCTLVRVTLECPGPSLRFFSTQIEAIGTVRDGIKAHANLLIGRVVHRDINIDNIMIVKNSKGLRGVIFDLDMALSGYAHERPPKSPEARSALRLYLSVALLRDQELSEMCAAVQDYLDDLEAFFYVLCKLLYGFRGVGTPVARSRDVRTSVLARWEIGVDSTIATNKYEFLQGTEVVEKPQRFWSTASVELGRKFGKYILGIIQEKDSIRQELDPDVRNERFRDLYDNIDSHYTTILGYFDEALVALAKPGGSLPRREDQPKPRPTTVVFSPVPLGAMPPNPFRRIRGSRGPGLTEYHLAGSDQDTGVPAIHDHECNRARCHRAELVSHPQTPSASRPSGSFLNIKILSRQSKLKRASEEVDDMEEKAGKRHRRYSRPFGLPETIHEEEDSIDSSDDSEAE